VYERLIVELENRSEIDNELSLYNKLGDLYLKAGKVGAAVEIYEKAAHRYAESGFPNNAIALCNKVLRNAPGRTPVYLKLAKLMLERGFTTEAKRNLLEYAERMQRTGQLDQAFTALKEFADLSPDNEEIRLLLAEQLKAAARTDEAREQLSKLFAEVEAHGDQRHVRATLSRMKVIDPEYDVEAAPRPQVAPRKKTADLIFLDLDEPSPASATRPETGTQQDLERTRAEPVEAEAPGGLAFIYPAPEPAPEVEAVQVTPIEDETVDATEGVTDEVAEGPPAERKTEELEIEQTSFEEETAEALASAYRSVEIEPTSLVDDEPEDAGDIDTVDVEQMATEYLEPEADIPVIEGLDVGQDFESPSVVNAGGLEIEPTVLEGAAAAAEELEADEGVEEEVSAEEPALGPAQHEREDDEVAVEAEDLGSEETDLGILEVPDLDVAVPAAEVGETESKSELEEVPVLDFEAGAGEADDPRESEISAVEPEPAATGAAPPIDAGAAATDLATLEARVADDPGNVELHRSLAEALLEAGERDRGIEELEVTLTLLEASEAWSSADAIVREILRLEPNSIRHHQKRVELAFHRGDKGALADAYVGLADALLREGAADRARAVYHRVLEHDPENERAQTGLATLEPEPAAAEPEYGADDRGSEEPAGPFDDEFVDLGALILEDEEMRVMDTRMRIEEEEPTGDEQRDFEEMLSEFKRGIEANLAEEDWQAHYDLGVAFKEMGLLDEAITEFQKALRAPEGRLKTAEALGLCFFDKAQHSVAATVLRRAVDADPGGDEAKIGLLYWLGRCEEELGRTEEALGHYQRVFSVDIGFQDVSERVRLLTSLGR
jgi:tetratricopeptide (TPR) repeat protein